MIVGSISENRDLEKRVAITPETAKKYTSIGFEVFLPENYGLHLGFKDQDFKSQGANFIDSENRRKTIKLT